MKKIILFFGVLMTCVNSSVADSEYPDSRYIAEMKKYEHELFLAAKEEKWDEVIKLADRFFMDMPNHPEILFLKAKALSHFGKYAEALEYYERILDMIPCYWWIETSERTFSGYMADCLFKLKKYERALLYYNNMFIGKDTILNDYIEEDMRKVREEFTKSDRYKKIKQLEKELDKAESLGKLDETITVTDELIKLTYKSEQMHCRKAKALALSGKHQEAIKLYKEALKYILYKDMSTDKEYHWNTKGINANDIHQLIVDSFMALEDFDGALEYYNSLTPFYRDNESLKQTIELVKASRERKLRLNSIILFFKEVALKFGYDTAR